MHTLLYIGIVMYILQDIMRIIHRLALLLGLFQLSSLLRWLPLAL